MWTLLKKETLENLITMRFIIGFLACNLVFGLITYVLMQDFQLELSRVSTAQEQSREATESWRVWSRVRPTIVKQPSILAVFGSNMGTNWGKRVWITHTRIPVLTTDETGDAGSTDLLAFLYEFDYTHIVQILVSLIALLLSFDALSGEKERGTLRQVLSNSIKRTTVFLSKFLGAFIALLIIVLTASIISLFIYLLHLPRTPVVEEWVSIVLIVAAGIVFGTVFIALGMMVSTFTSKTSSALIVCMLVWVMLVIVLPNSVGFLSSTFGFSQDLVDYQRGLDALDNEYADKMQMFVPLRDFTFFADYYLSPEGRIRFTVMGDNYLKLHLERQQPAIDAQFEYAVKRYDLEKDFRDGRAQKMTLSNILLMLSPSTLYGNVVNALARVDAANHEAFMEQARLYREEVISFIRSNGGYSTKRWFTFDRDDASYRDRIRELEKLTMEEYGHITREDPDFYTTLQSWIMEMYRHPEAVLDLSAMPKFAFRPLPLADVVKNTWFDFFLLIVVFSIVIVVSYIRFLSYDPR
ncbi:MAG TPA: ABC transporter permease subunit [Acidobacteriota bacterium]|nr:ABC transporter permease subunit [Acidobacteriota bacterium]